jgi:adenylate kinase
MINVLNFSSYLIERELPDSQGKIIVVLGPPGSGKGTITKNLKQDYDFQEVKVKELMTSDPNKAKGKDIVTERGMMELLREKLKDLDFSKNIVFDGFPRTRKQSVILDKVLGEMGLGLNRAIFLDVEKSIAMKRLRKKAEKDSKSFDEEKEEKRFQDYEVKTLPVIDQYKKSRKVLEIKDLGDSQKITQNIVKKLGVSTIKDKLKKEE